MPPCRSAEPSRKRGHPCYASVSQSSLVRSNRARICRRRSRSAGICLDVALSEIYRVLVHGPAIRRARELGSCAGRPRSQLRHTASSDGDAYARTAVRLAAADSAVSRPAAQSRSTKLTCRRAAPGISLRKRFGGGRGIRSLWCSLDSVSYTSHIAGNASVAVGPCPFLPADGAKELSTEASWINSRQRIFTRLDPAARTAAIAAACQQSSETLRP
jgi:hypothetical protein